MTNYTYHLNNKEVSRERLKNFLADCIFFRPVNEFFSISDEEQAEREINKLQRQARNCHNGCSTIYVGRRYSYYVKKVRG